MAKAVFDYLATHKGNPDFKIETLSAGTAAYHVGEAADPRVLATCAQHKVHVAHKARQVTLQMIMEADLILAMDPQNLNHLKSICPKDFQNRLKLMGDFDPVNPGASVPDPYYGSMTDFENVFEQLYRCSESLIDHLIAQRK